mgnify:FL=1
MNTTTGSATFNENLQILSTLYQDPKSGKFEQKKVH